jgi:hypothetical protein
MLGVYTIGRQQTQIETKHLRFYALSMNEYVDHWKLGYDQVITRSRTMSVENGANKFGNNRGIPTYNEGGRGEVILGIDQTASIIAAYKAYAE